MKRDVLGSFVLAFMATCNLACEIDTRLNVTGNNPPQFRMTGSGQLTSIRVVGPHKQQEVEGEDQYMYWMIRPKDEDSQRNVRRISPVTYGVVPDGYVQVYPAYEPSRPLQ